MRYYYLCLISVFILVFIIKEIRSDAVPPAPAGAPALPNIPGLSAIVDDLMKVVEKAKSRWDAFQNGYGSGYVPELTDSGVEKPESSGPGLAAFFLRSLALANLLFPNRRRGPSRDDLQLQIPQSKHFNPFEVILDGQETNIPIPLPYQIQPQQLRRSSQITPVTSPSGAVFLPKNVAPSIKLIHRPATPVSNCIHGQPGSLCLDSNQMPVNLNEWEDLYSNIHLTDY